MEPGKAAAFWGGAGLVWRRQALVWWIFAVNFVLAFIAIRDVTPRLGGVWDHSLAAQRVVNGFDLGALGELTLQPGISPLSVSPAAVAYSFVFFAFMLFVTGGVLEVYRRDMRLATGEFFEACGVFFWRFVRLVVFLLLCLIPIGIVQRIFVAITNRVDERAVSAMTSVWFRIGFGIVLLLLLLILRLWFDMAEVHCVAQNERSVRRALGKAWKLTFGNLGALGALYFGITVLCAGGFGLGLWLWMWLLPPAAITGAFLLGQAMILWWIGTRLWQRAAETIWYQRYCERVAAKPTAAPWYQVVEPNLPPLPMPPERGVSEV